MTERWDEISPRPAGITSREGHEQAWAYSKRETRGGSFEGRARCNRMLAVPVHREAVSRAAARAGKTNCTGERGKLTAGAAVGARSLLLLHVRALGVPWDTERRTYGVSLGRRRANMRSISDPDSDFGSGF